ncbi:MAG: methyltransferase [Clostridia bacterium]|nr:methyltransferase [Clostridia bacterium]
MENLRPTEHIEYIDSSLKLIVSDSHTFGTDALLLAAFSSPKRKNTVCDFGTGCGIIPFYWLREGVERVHAVEIQPLACDQLQRSIEINGIGEKFTLLNCDLRELKGKLSPGSFDLITMNPPYTAEGHGIESSSAADKIARHETSLTLGELFLSASSLLKFGGRMCICLRPERLTEAMAEMRNAKIEPKRLRFVSQRDGKAPWLFLLEGKKGRNPGLIVENELHIENPDGTPSRELLGIIGSYKKD